MIRRRLCLSVRELAKGWEPHPGSIMSSKQIDLTRKQFHIIVSGEDIPPPIKNFNDMNIPRGLGVTLKEKGIVKPTPIQVQGLPVILSGRDFFFLFKPYFHQNLKEFNSTKGEYIKATNNQTN